MQDKYYIKTNCCIVRHAIIVDQPACIQDDSVRPVQGEDVEGIRICALEIFIVAC